MLQSGCLCVPLSGFGQTPKYGRSSCHDVQTARAEVTISLPSVQHISQPLLIASCQNLTDRSGATPQRAANLQFCNSDCRRDQTALRNITRSIHQLLHLMRELFPKPRNRRTNRSDFKQPSTNLAIKRQIFATPSV